VPGKIIKSICIAPLIIFVTIDVNRFIADRHETGRIR
jgi:hypothetical protein